MCASVRSGHYMAAVPQGFRVQRSYSPEPHSEDVREDERGQENFEELGREDSSFLHHTGVPHAQSAGTLRVPQQKLPTKG